MKKRWLANWPWQTAVTINAALCKEKNALHKPTSDGYDSARKIWEAARDSELTLREVFDLCRKCHKLAPFCFYNGNTFAAIGRTIIQDILQKMSPVKAHNFRSVVGHYIAGTIGSKEMTDVLADLEC
ncbi:MAG: hypothetical protein ACREFE_02670 [Limisphaerales bacterium]